MNLYSYFIVSFFAELSVVYYAYHTNRQFYPTILFLVSSKVSVVFAGNFVFAGAVMIAKLIQFLYFGSLRTLEVEILAEKAKYAFIETCLALTIFRSELTAPIVALFGLLIFAKLLHKLTKSRLEYLEQIADVSFYAQLRMGSLLLTLLSIDSLVVYYSIQNFLLKGRSVLILFGFEFGLLVNYTMNLLIRYILQNIDSHLANGFPARGFCMMIVELFIEVVKVITYAIFFVLIFINYGLPIHLIRDLWAAYHSFHRKLIGFIKYLQVTRNLESRFPDATTEECTNAGHCLVCREEMSAGKRLPCNHVFHIDCLRMWLQHQQSCPLCRADIQASPVEQPQPEQPAVVNNNDNNNAAAVAAEPAAVAAVAANIGERGGEGGQQQLPSGQAEGVAATTAPSQVPPLAADTATTLSSATNIPSLPTGRARRQAAAEAAAARIAAAVASTSVTSSSTTAIPNMNSSFKDQSEEEKQYISGLASSAGEYFRGLQKQRDENVAKKEGTEDTLLDRSGLETDDEEMIMQLMMQQKKVVTASSPSSSSSVLPESALDRPRVITSLPRFYVLIDTPHRAATAPIYRYPSRITSENNKHHHLISANHIVRQVALGTIVWVSCRIVGQDQEGAHWLKIPDGWILEEEMAMGIGYRRGVHVVAKYWMPLVNMMSNYHVDSLAELERGLGMKLYTLPSSSIVFEKREQQLTSSNKGNETSNNYRQQGEVVGLQQEQQRLLNERMQEAMKNQSTVSTLPASSSSPSALQEVAALQQQMTMMAKNIMEMQSMMLSCQMTLSKLITDGVEGEAQYNQQKMEQLMLPTKNEVTADNNEQLQTSKQQDDGRKETVDTREDKKKEADEVKLDSSLGNDH